MNVHLALIGYGYWGPNLARNFHQLENCQLAACCDLDGARLAIAQRLYPTVRTTEDYASVLNDPTIEAVVIATPVRTHFQLAKQALECGKHVLVEKPLTMSSPEAEQLIELAEKQQRILMVGHVFEYNPALLKTKELISSGQVGDLYYLYSTRVSLGQVQHDLNALWSIAPHDVSILLYLLERMPLEVSAHGGKYLNRDIEDVVFAHLLFPEGIVAHIHASWLDPGKVRRLTIVGSKKMLIYDDIDPESKVKVYEKGVFNRGGGIYGEFQLRLRSGDIYLPKIDTTEPLRNECAHFIECIQQRRKPHTDGQNGLRVIKVLEAAQRSLQSGISERIR